MPGWRCCWQSLEGPRGRDGPFSSILFSRPGLGGATKEACKRLLSSCWRRPAAALALGCHDAVLLHQCYDHCSNTAVLLYRSPCTLATALHTPSIIAPFLSNHLAHAQHVLHDETVSTCTRLQTGQEFSDGSVIHPACHAFDAAISPQWVNGYGSEATTFELTSASWASNSRCFLRGVCHTISADGRQLESLRGVCWTEHWCQRSPNRADARRASLCFKWPDGM